MPKPKKTARDVRAAAVPATLEVPRFASEADERAFWQEQDTADHVDWSRAERVRLPNLKPSTATISLRLPEGMLEELKVLANQRDVPYQSLLKVFLAERLAAERARKRRAS
jgi:predicted DNA binding CopG/RHH family protein